MNWAQVTIAVLLLVGLVLELYWACNGAPARPPRGFRGVAVALVAFVIKAWLFWAAGLFGGAL